MWSKSRSLSIIVLSVCVLWSVIGCENKGQFSIKTETDDEVKLQPAAKPESVTAHIANESIIPFGSDKPWMPPDASINVSVIVTMRLTVLAKYSTDDFMLSWNESDGKHTTACLGYRIGDIWHVTGVDMVISGSSFQLRGKSGDKLELTTGPKAHDIDFLFVVPKRLTNATLLFKGESIGEALTIQQ